MRRSSRVCSSRKRRRLHPCHRSRQTLSSPRLPTSRMMMCARVHRLLLSMGAQLPRSAPRGRERPWCSMKNSMSLLPRAAQRAGLRVYSRHCRWWDPRTARAPVEARCQGGFGPCARCVGSRALTYEYRGNCGARARQLTHSGAGHTNRTQESGLSTQQSVDAIVN